MISLRQIISRSAIPIFAIFSLKESVFGANDRSGLFLPHEAMLNAVFAVVVCLSLRLSVCLSVCHTGIVSQVALLWQRDQATRSFVAPVRAVKTAKRRITQITPHDSPLTLVF